MVLFIVLNPAVLILKDYFKLVIKKKRKKLTEAGNAKRAGICRQKFAPIELI